MAAQEMVTRLARAQLNAPKALRSSVPTFKGKEFLTMMIHCAFGLGSELSAPARIRIASAASLAEALVMGERG